MKLVTAADYDTTDINGDRLVLCAFQNSADGSMLTMDKSGVSFLTVTSKITLVSLESTFLEHVVSM